ncbi:MAG: hypothetical protein HY397_03730 [Candidatus Doudnabacteria bacterium]|nr:hypothetical protein [Candidatus Doudnabacteria bacterium]
MKNRRHKTTFGLWGTALLLAGGLLFFIAIPKVQAATLTLAPPRGSFTVGSTFDVTIYLDTQKQSINALRTYLTFPPDKLQLVPRGAEKSIITVYSSPPRYDNTNGIADLQGGIPGGINLNNGQVITFTFRVKAVGTALIQFLDETKVLANDGLGTNVLSQAHNGIYDLALPPPAGPVVVSETHPDQAKWHPNTTAWLKWAPDDAGVEAYSYILNDTPTDIPDDISEGARTDIAYRNLGDGVRYFHIKSLRRGSWGGVTHFALNIDSSPPAEFPIEIVPGPRTTRKQPVIQFASTDTLSGLDHYELKLIPLTPEAISIGQGPPLFLVPLTAAASGVDRGQPLFIEVDSPYVAPELTYGSYDVIVRAYDRAGNFQEQVQRLKIVSALFRNISGQGLEFRSRLIIPWIWIWIFAGLLLLALSYLAWRLERWHRRVHEQRASRQLPAHLTEQLDELKKFREKYGKIAVLLLAVTLAAFAPVGARADTVELTPPYISIVSKDISNEEIFYVGGKTDSSNVGVVIYLQNLQTGETISQTVTSEKNGDWFYRHDTFLPGGRYLLWTQSKLGGQVSPPSPQVQLDVKPTAIQFGASRISSEFLYLFAVIVLLLVISALTAYILFHVYHGRKKHKLFLKEVQEAEESLRRGFAVLRRDIEAELEVIKKVKLSEKISAEEREKEEQLLKDLEQVEKYVEKEIWDIEKVEQAR